MKIDRTKYTVSNCPFCNGDDLKVYDVTTCNGLLAEGCVECITCSAMGPFISNLVFDSEHANTQNGDAMIEAIIDAWNVRY